MQAENPFIVIEKEFKSDRTHQAKVTGLALCSKSEFVSSSLDSSLRVWDKEQQCTDYTYETPNPVSCMTVSGEHREFIVAGMAHDIVVYGKHYKNQLEIYDHAHTAEITQIVSLDKLQGKYFATRCLDGHVNIWSSQAHPDRLFTIWFFDAQQGEVQSHT